MTAHTPGPWRFMSTGEYLAVFANMQGGTKVICPVKIADEADAHLIAAAPDLLEAAKLAVSNIMSIEAHYKLSAAIAKAEGRS